MRTGGNHNNFDTMDYGVAGPGVTVETATSFGDDEEDMGQTPASAVALRLDVGGDQGFGTYLCLA